MNALRFTASRFPSAMLPSSNVNNTLSRRPLSTQTTQAVHKLRSVLEDYRQVHYTQEIPSRFKKEIVRAASGNPRSTMRMQQPKQQSSSSSPNSSSSAIAMDGLKRVLVNIGAEDRLANAELQAIFEEVGDQSGQIPAQRFYQIL